MRPSRQKRGGPRKGKPTTTKGRDDMRSNMTRQDYFVPTSYELTPHPSKELTAVLGLPVMDRRFKYSILESQLAGSNATSATPLSLVSINQGTTDITRTGDRIRMKRLWLSGRVYGNITSVVSTTTRVIVVCWNPVGTGSVNAPIASMIVQHSSNYGPYGSYSRDFGDSFQVVYDAVFSVQPNVAASESDLFHCDRAIKIDAEFTAGATTPTTNNLYVFCLTDVGTLQPTLVFSSTVWYEDLDA